MSGPVSLTRLRILAVAAALASFAVIAGCSTTKPVSLASASDRTAEALAPVNALRARSGLSALSSDPAAVTAAREQAVRMAKAGRMAHLIGVGDDFGDRMKRNGVVLPAAENIASGQAETSRAVDAWIASPKHLHNMLGAYRGVGVAVSLDPAGRPYWAMVLSN